MKRTDPARSTALLATAIGAFFVAPSRAAEPHLLEADPPCVEARLGRVQVTLGEARPDPRRGGSVPVVSYARALAKLVAAGAERGADAVVLREHQADYFAKGSRRPSRPTYVVLAGAAMRLKASGAGCVLAAIDPAEYERAALEKDRARIDQNAGVSF